MNKYLAECDEFYVNVNLNTAMALPTGRDTVLHFFEQMKKRYPDLRNFSAKEEGDLVLEGDKEAESYRVVAIEAKRLCSGNVNPASLEDAYAQHELVLDLAPHFLTISTLDCEALDVMFGFDFDYEGPHDEVVAEALGVGSGFEGLAQATGSKVLNFEPSITIALDETCRLQARLVVETRTSAIQVRSGEYDDDQISVYFTIRQYWGNGPDRSFVESFRAQAAIGEALVRDHVVPRIIHPLARAIASRS